MYRNENVTTSIARIATERKRTATRDGLWWSGCLAVSSISSVGTLSYSMARQFVPEWLRNWREPLVFDLIQTTVHMNSGSVWNGNVWLKAAEKLTSAYGQDMIRTSFTNDQSWRRQTDDERLACLLETKTWTLRVGRIVILTWILLVGCT